jgi:hypothetical protein
MPPSSVMLRVPGKWLDRVLLAAIVALLAWAIFNLLSRKEQDVRLLEARQRAFVEEVRAADPGCAGVLEQAFMNSPVSPKGVRASIQQAARNPSCGRDLSRHWLALEFSAK